MWRRPSKHWRHFGAFCFSCSLGSLSFPSLVLWCVVVCSSDSSVFEPAFLCLSYPFLLCLSIVWLVCTCLYTVSTPCSSPDFLLSLLCFLLLSRLPGSVAHVLQPVLPRVLLLNLDQFMHASVSLRHKYNALTNGIRALGCLACLAVGQSSSEALKRKLKHIMCNAFP